MKDDKIRKRTPSLEHGIILLLCSMVAMKKWYLVKVAEYLKVQHAVWLLNELVQGRYVRHDKNGYVAPTKKGFNVLTKMYHAGYLASVSEASQIPPLQILQTAQQLETLTVQQSCPRFN